MTNTATPDRTRLKWLKFIWSSAINLIVIFLLVFVGWWGNENHWKFPKFTELFSKEETGNESSKEEEWCKEHNVAKAICIECHQELWPELNHTGWCEEHGVQDCVLCHPELAQLDGAQYPVTAEMKEKATAAIQLRPRAKNQKDAKIFTRRLQIPSWESMEKNGIRFAKVSVGEVIESIPVYGEIIYDELKNVHINSRSPGSVYQVYKKIGESVQAGEILALIDAPEVGKAKSEFQQALLQEKIQELKLKDITSVKEGSIAKKDVIDAKGMFNEAKVRLASARQNLINLGFPMHQIDVWKQKDSTAVQSELLLLGLPEGVKVKLDLERESNHLLPIRSSISGTIVQQDIVRGEVIDTMRVLYQVVDLKQIWVHIAIRNEDLRLVHLNKTKILFQPDGSDREIEGTINWISSAADEKTRMVHMRAVLPNVNGELRIHTFGTGRLILRRDPQAILIPKNALFWDGESHLVFVRSKGFPDSPESSEKKDSHQEGMDKENKPAPILCVYPRVVRPGIFKGDQIEIITGLLPGETIVETGGETLRGELLRGKLGETE